MDTLDRLSVVVMFGGLLALLLLQSHLADKRLDALEEQPIKTIEVNEYTPDVHTGRSGDWWKGYYIGMTNGLLSGLDSIMLLNLENQLKGTNMTFGQMNEVAVGRHKGWFERAEEMNQP